MKKVLISLIAFCFSSSSYAVEHIGKKVSVVQSSTTTNCVYIQLENVLEADPVKPNSPWFAVAKDNASKADVLGIAMTAFTADLSVTVKTTNSIVCNQAEISNIRLVK